MIEQENKISERPGYQAGYMQGQRKERNAKDDVRAEILQAFCKAMIDSRLPKTHPVWVVLDKYAGQAKPKQARARRLCKGSTVKWEAASGQGLYDGGMLAKFIKYEHGEGEVWKVKMVPNGEVVERLVTIDMITRFGPMKRPRTKG